MPFPYALSWIKEHGLADNPQQVEQFEAMDHLYTSWNRQLNLISRKDMAHFYLHHVLHSLSIARCISFVQGTDILDFGTGGGFPGIPLAIAFPEVHFHLIDSVQKKVRAVNAIAEALELKNITVEWIRGEKLNGSYDFILGRAITHLPRFYNWVKDKIKSKNKNSLQNGILYLKGIETTSLPFLHTAYPLKNYFKANFFEEKYLIHGYTKSSSSEL